jgi:hypothetical protein
MSRHDYQWINSRTLKMPCMECRQDFEAVRRDACFCSSTCRKKASRRKERVQRAALNAIREIEFLKETRRLRPDLEVFVHEAFITLIKQLDVTTGVSQVEVHRYL